MCRVFRDYSRYFMQLVGQDLRQNPDFAAIINVQGQYGMFLLAAMQTDYSTEEMKVNQKMFRFRGAAGVDLSAARAAGFTNNELIKQNFQHGKPGQFVIEFPGFSHFILTPMYDVEAKLAEKFGYIPSFGQSELSETPPEKHKLKPSRNEPETALKNTETARDERFQEVRELKEKGWGKVKTIEKVYQAKPGESKKYLEAEVEYLEFLTIIASEERIEDNPCHTVVATQTFIHHA